MSASWPDYIVCDCGRKVDVPSQWISVNDHLPDVNASVICGGLVDDKWEQDIGFRSSIDTNETDWCDFWFDVSHWMPLPDAPK